MNTKPDCIVCMLNQSLAIGRMSGLSESEIESAFYEVIEKIPKQGKGSYPPQMMALMNDIINAKSGIDDPYFDIKRKSNEEALKLYPELVERVGSSEHPLAEALCLAIAGNLIDFGAKASLDINKALMKIFDQPLFKNIEAGDEFDNGLFHLRHFLRDLETAKNIIYLGDNAGEIVFDRVLIETVRRLYPDKKFTFVVRGGPALNDVLMPDAEDVGVDQVAEVVSSGCRTAGTVLKECSPGFLDLLYGADLIISKGQGNFESLSGEKMPPAYFLFKVKCLAVAEDAGGPVGTLALLKNEPLSKSIKGT